MADSRAKPQRFGPKMGTCAPHGPKMVHVAPHMLRGLFVGAKASGFRPMRWFDTNRRRFICGPPIVPFAVGTMLVRPICTICHKVDIRLLKSESASVQIQSALV